MSKITARYEGTGRFADPDAASVMDGDDVPEGGTFETTKTRLKALQAQGHAVVEVEAPAADDAPTPATTTKEPAK